MGKLPATSYVRLVDIWLIFGQLVPFLEELVYFIVTLSNNIHFQYQVVLFTIIELYNEGDDTINHHGFARKVEEGQNESQKSKNKKRIFNFATFFGMPDCPQKCD